MARVRTVSSSFVVLFLLASGHAGAQAEATQGAPVEGAASQADEYDDADPSALTDFQATLNPHGTWVEDAVYGTAWTPSANEVGADFQPYETAGRWDYSDGDYSWVSDYTWGWVCFHYGRWARSPAHWLWIPGRAYAGAWVNWRIGGDEHAYLGWAPMPPTWLWMGGSAASIGFSSPEPWVFSAYANVFGPGLSSHTITGSGAAALLGHTHPYVASQPALTTLAESPLAAHGPPPAVLGIDVVHLPHSPPNAREVRARQFAHPSTAIALGGHPASPHVLRRSAATVARPQVGVSPQTGASPRGSDRGRR